MVQAQPGALIVNGGATNLIGGSWIVTNSATLERVGSWTDAGGSASGGGAVQFNSGTLLLRTNIIPGLLLSGGNI